MNKLEILEYYCKHDYLPPKVAVAVSFGVDPTKIEKCVSIVEETLSFVGNKTLLDKPIGILVSIDELTDEINSRLSNIRFIRGHKQEQVSIIDKSLKNDDEKPLTTEVNSQEYHALYDVFFAKCRHFIKEYTQRVNLLENAIAHGKILLNKSEVQLIDFVSWCEQKNLSFPQKLKELVKKYTLSYVDLEARCAEYELNIKELEEKNTDLDEQLKPLHRSKEKSYKQLIFILAYTMYSVNEYSHKDFETFLPKILEDTQSLRDNADLKLPFELPCDKTITEHYNNSIDTLFHQNKPSIKKTKKKTKK